MSSRDSVGSSSDSSCSSRSSYASSSGSFPSIASTISSIFSRRSTPLPELPTSSLQSPQDKAIENVSNVTYFESKSRRDKSYGDNTSTYLVNVCSNEPLNHQIPTRQKLLTTAQNGPSALARLQDVQNVFCVAFGIFDRYYVAWKDTRGEKHQGTLQTIAWLFVDNWNLTVVREQQAAPTFLRLAASRKWPNTTSAFMTSLIRYQQ